MSDIPAGPRFAVVFDDDLWRREVGRLAPNSRGRIAAEAARRVLERDGVHKDRLAACEAEAADGTRLGGLVKLRIPLGGPAPAAPYGFVLEPALDEAGRLELRACSRSVSATLSGPRLAAFTSERTTVATAPGRAATTDAQRPPAARVGRGEQATVVLPKIATPAPG